MIRTAKGSLTMRAVLSFLGKALSSQHVTPSGLTRLPAGLVSLAGCETGRVNSMAGAEACDACGMNQKELMMLRIQFTRAEMRVMYMEPGEGCGRSGTSRAPL